MKVLCKRLLIGALIGTMPLLLSGCFLRLFFGTVAERDTGFGNVFIATFGGTWGPMAICDFDDETGALVECSYTFLDFEADPPIVERTSTAQLVSEFGILGLFVDPLILQVPAGATNITGTIDDGSGAIPIVITEVGSFKAQPGIEVPAEPGQKFVILELPPDLLLELEAASVLDGPFDFAFEFELPRPPPVDVKAMFSGKVEANGETFYPPMLPCVTDFAGLPAITVPVSPSEVDLSQVISVLRLNPDLACDDILYDFTPVGGPATREVAIDIKPGSDPNALGARSRGVIPVAILTTAMFDATTVDPASVEFGPGGASKAHRRGHVEDVDGDGDLALLLHLRAGATGIGCGDAEATLIGATFDGRGIFGSDAVRVVGCW